MHEQKKREIEFDKRSIFVFTAEILLAIGFIVRDYPQILLLSSTVVLAYGLYHLIYNYRLAHWILLEAEVASFQIDRFYRNSMYAPWLERQVVYRPQIFYSYTYKNHSYSSSCLSKTLQDITYTNEDYLRKKYRSALRKKLIKVWINPRHPDQSYINIEASLFSQVIYYSSLVVGIFGLLFSWLY